MISLTNTRSPPPHPQSHLSISKSSVIHCHVTNMFSTPEMLSPSDSGHLSHLVSHPIIQLLLSNYFLGTTLYPTATPQVQAKVTSFLNGCHIFLNGLSFFSLSPLIHSPQCTDENMIMTFTCLKSLRTCTLLL